MNSPTPLSNKIRAMLNSPTFLSSKIQATLNSPAPVSRKKQAILNPNSVTQQNPSCDTSRNSDSSSWLGSSDSNGRFTELRNCVGRANLRMRDRGCQFWEYRAVQDVCSWCFSGSQRIKNGRCRDLTCSLGRIGDISGDYSLRKEVKKRRGSTVGICHVNKEVTLAQILPTGGDVACTRGAVACTKRFSNFDIQSKISRL